MGIEGREDSHNGIKKKKSNTRLLQLFFFFFFCQQPACQSFEAMHPSRPLLVSPHSDQTDQNILSLAHLSSWRAQLGSLGRHQDLLLLILLQKALLVFVISCVCPSCSWLWNHPRHPRHPHHHTLLRLPSINEFVKFTRKVRKTCVGLYCLWSVRDIVLNYFNLHLLEIHCCAHFL